MSFTGGVLTCTNDPFVIVNGTVNVTYLGRPPRPLEWDVEKCTSIELQDADNNALDPPASTGALKNIFRLAKGRLNQDGVVTMGSPLDLEPADRAVLEHAFKIGGRLYIRVPQTKGDGLPLYIRLEGS